MTDEEIAKLDRMAPEMPEKIEFEPGKFAIYDPQKCYWIYRNVDTGEIIIINV